MLISLFKKFQLKTRTLDLFAFDGFSMKKILVKQSMPMKNDLIIM